ncbi:MAG: hypothetical protein ACRD8Z_26635, partial [Nitrososphaeraceae archaeon]
MKQESTRARMILVTSIAAILLVSISGLTTGHIVPSAYAATAAAASSNAACGQVVSGVVNLTANLNCSGDGIIVGGPNTVINMNGFSITGPGQDSSKVGIMVPNVDKVVVNGPGSISNFQAGVLLTGTNGFKINSVIISNNQIGTFMTGAENAQVQQNIIQGNSIG